MSEEQHVGGGNLRDPGTAKTVSGIDEQIPTADGIRRAVMFDFDAASVTTVYLYAGRRVKPKGVYWHAGDYVRYLSVAHAWAHELKVAPDEVEFLMFRDAFT